MLFKEKADSFFMTYSSDEGIIFAEFFLANGAQSWNPQTALHRDVKSEILRKPCMAFK